MSYFFSNIIYKFKNNLNKNIVEKKNIFYNTIYIVNINNQNVKICN